mmetsp:Transcript_12532/g.11367  ORF Transcript_12532/g.11367 Transcript_12532/m.11367 type:complete len:761 (+) Transcript_12532:28-2310(+)
MSELEYFQSLPDYNEISKDLELDEEGYEPQIDIPPFVPDYSTAVCVDGTPITTNDKAAKLLSTIHKVFLQFSPTLTEDDIELPIDEVTGNTCGFCFINFSSKAEADAAIFSAQGFKMGKTNIFNLCPYANIDKFANMTENFIAPTIEPFKPRPETLSWLCDSYGRDQFALRYGKETEVLWANTTPEDPIPIYTGEHEKKNGKSWCESRIMWSPQGTYLTTFHRPGIKLWGTEKKDASVQDFISQKRFEHNNVEDSEFSPCENYLVTYKFTDNSYDQNSKPIILWNVLTGEEMRSFKLKNPLEPKYLVKATIKELKITKSKDPNSKDKEVKTEVDRIIRGRVISYSNKTFVIEENNEKYEVKEDKVESLQEPNRLKWSPDGKYIARLGADVIQVFSLPDMELVGKSSFQAKDILDFIWSPSPKSNLISYWTMATTNHPATINIISIPSKQEVCSRKFFDVLDGKMIWQNNGDYLCVKITKKKNTTLVFFRLLDNGVPVEQLDFTETISNVVWEPNGDRFVVVLGERNPTISFYSMSGAATKTPNRKEITLLYSLNNIQCTEPIWSPAGGFIALAHFTGESCTFHIHDVDSNIHLATRTHMRCNRLYWDPSGRLIVTCTITELRNINVRGFSEDGYNIYTFQGNLLVSIKKEKLFYFLWRPRPKNLLSNDLKKNILKNFKKYEKTFEKVDRQHIEELNKEILDSRRKLAQDFFNHVQGIRLYNQSIRSKRIASRGGYDSDDDSNYHIDVQVTETVIESVKSK